MTPESQTLFDEIVALCTPPRLVYPFYLTSRVRRGLEAAAKADSEHILDTIAPIESLGNSRYALRVTDTSGTRYRITVEVEE